MAADMNFYKRFIGDYARDTGDLTLCEHGAFTLMLDNFYAMGKPLPRNKKALYRLLRAESDTERKAIDAVSLRFWRALPESLEAIYKLLDLRTEEDQQHYREVAAAWEECGGLINVRALREIVKAHVIGEKNRQTAIERENKKRQKAVLEIVLPASARGNK